MPGLKLDETNSTSSSEVESGTSSGSSAGASPSESLEVVSGAGESSSSSGSASSSGCSSSDSDNLPSTSTGSRGVAFGLSSLRVEGVIDVDLTTDTVELTPNSFYVLQELEPNQPIGINVRYQLTNSTVLTWQTIYMDETLYIEVPHGCLPDASKDAFVALLEYAEEVLMCQRAIIYFSKERNERDTLIRTFMFMGFFAVPPESPILHFHDSKNVYMVYQIR